MGKNKTALAMLALLIVGIAAGSAIYLVAHHFLNADKAETNCGTTGKNISITIKDDAFSEKQINGKLCDTLTITNTDDKVRNIAFGVHDKHEPYDGVTEKLLQKGSSLTVTLNKTGTYEVHDHLEDETQAFFTVSK
jgi:hypothetical protein